MKSTTQKVEKLLKNKGMRITNERKHVLHFLMHAAKPLSTEEIHTHLKEEVNKVTLYRMLKQFVKKGLIYQAHFRENKSYFEYQNDHHHHITCTECGRQEKVSSCVQPPKNKLSYFDNVESHILEYFGTCRSCKS